jgi:hypothetical protein
VKSHYLIPIAFSAMLFGCAIAGAQTSPNSPAGPTAAAPNTNQADVSNGNDLVDTSQAVPRTESDNPRSAGEDKADGNDLVSPSFNSLDTKKKGSLTADDVKGHKWLRQNFSRCDTDHDGTLNRKEYSACK